MGLTSSPQGRIFILCRFPHLYSRAPDERLSSRHGFANISFDELPYTMGTLRPHGTDHLHEAHTHESKTTGRSSAGSISSDYSPGSKKLRNKLIATGHDWLRKIQSSSVAERPRSRSRGVVCGASSRHPYATLLTASAPSITSPLAVEA